MDEQQKPAPAPKAVPFQDFLPDADAIEQRPLAGVARWTLYTVVAMVVVFLIWATLSDVDEIVVGRGKLITVQPNLQVQPLETSIVQSIDVKVGQVVKKGQRLAALDPTFASADESQLKGRHLSLDAQTTRLEAELAGKAVSPGTPGTGSDARLQADIRSEKDANFRARLRKLDESLAKLNASLVTNRRDQDVLDARVKSLREIEAMQERLVAQNFGAKQKLLEAREKRLEVERDLDLARNREAEIKREIAGEHADRDAFRKDWRQKSMEELANVRRERDSIGEQLQKAEKRRNLVIMTAPVDAVVLDVAKRSIGSVVREAEPLVTLVALDAPLEAEVQIDATDVGFVKTGDAVRVKIDAFPFQKHGTLPGRVTVVSEDAFARDPAQMRATGQTGDAYYLGRVGLESTKLGKTGANFRLLPGLTLSAEIIVGRRSVISYFLYPLIRALDESIREPR
ncbi:HlyD family type I secretion periplasmic adaptor subunit [Sulfurisoma sediminicola]|uniref:Membrane fusion protein (MFP) family protein n=1 Tax=Sulfurisoma sediminicola TaxID=1381557 RepID=A0A497XCR8_9PROT|nr:HlyD family type I secretion periplasmic adaptor subunit [Sulfurisoma sediminicola]RLJ64731.1 HlyD family secretion protein [Sulfurisoma sediminicola]